MCDSGTILVTVRIQGVERQFPSTDDLRVFNRDMGAIGLTAREGYNIEKDTVLFSGQLGPKEIFNLFAYLDQSRLIETSEIDPSGGISVE